MIGILFFAIVLWISSAVSYPVSATMLTALTAVLLGTAPNIDAPTKILGTSNALKIAISGYSTPAWALVAAAMFISMSMTKTGLDRRIALNVLSRIGTKTSHIYIGVIFTGFILFLLRTECDSPSRLLNSDYPWYFGQLRHQSSK